MTTLVLYLLLQFSTIGNSDGFHQAEKAPSIIQKANFEEVGGTWDDEG